jgi:hypothetical protein
MPMDESVIVAIDDSVHTYSQFNKILMIESAILKVF